MNAGRESQICKNLISKTVFRQVFALQFGFVASWIKLFILLQYQISIGCRISIRSNLTLHQRGKQILKNIYNIGISLNLFTHMSNIFVFLISWSLLFVLKFNIFILFHNSDFHCLSGCLLFFVFNQLAKLQYIIFINFIAFKVQFNLLLSNNVYSLKFAQPLGRFSHS